MYTRSSFQHSKIITYLNKSKKVFFFFASPLYVTYANNYESEVNEENLAHFQLCAFSSFLLLFLFHFCSFIFTLQFFFHPHSSTHKLSHIKHIKFNYQENKMRKKSKNKIVKLNETFQLHERHIQRGRQRQQKQIFFN